MTVSSTTSKSGPYNGNGVTTTFAYGFKAFAEGDLQVIKTSTAGVDSTLVLNTDYTVTGVGNSGGGDVVLGTAPASGEKVTIIRDMDFVQELDLVNQGTFYAETIEAQFDKMTLMLQQLDEEVGRSLKGSASGTSTPDDLVTQLEGYVSDASGSATAAAASATAASDDADAAAASAASINLPSIAGNGESYLRAKADESGQEYRTAAQVRSDLGLGALATGSDAGDVPFTPAGSIVASDVQAAIEELDTETDARLDALEAASTAVMWFKDVKADGTDGGTFTSGAWQTRDLNDTTGTISGASLGSNQITLPAGTYEVWASVPAYRVGRHQAKLRNVTDGSDAILGSAEYTNAASTATAQSVSIIGGIVTIAGTKVFEVQHYSQGTFSTEGFGLAGSFGSGEVYTTVKIRKL